MGLRASLADNKEKAALLSTNQESIPMLKNMIKNNRGTLDMPYAEMLKLPTRMLASDQAAALDLIKQDLNTMAIPLAKKLGVNPTDKDVELIMNSIVDLNASKKSRDSQLKNLLKRMESSDSGQETEPQGGQPTPDQIRAELNRRRGQ